MAPIAHQPGPGGYQGTSTPQLVGSVVLGCTAAPAVPPARDLDFFISTGDLTPAGRTGALLSKNPEEYRSGGKRFVHISSLQLELCLLPFFPPSIFDFLTCSWRFSACCVLRTAHCARRTAHCALIHTLRAIIRCPLSSMLCPLSSSPGLRSWQPPPPSPSDGENPTRATRWCLPLNAHGAGEFLCRYY
jgi:hypothetical protein